MKPQKSVIFEDLKFLNGKSTTKVANQKLFQPIFNNEVYVFTIFLKEYNMNKARPKKRALHIYSWLTK